MDRIEDILLKKYNFYSTRIMNSLYTYHNSTTRTISTIEVQVLHDCQISIFVKLNNLYYINIVENIDEINHLIIIDDKIAIRIL